MYLFDTRLAPNSIVCNYHISCHSHISRYPEKPNCNVRCGCTLYRSHSRWRELSPGF